MAVAPGGGHIAALHFPGMPEAANPYWQPPWTSLEPENVSREIVEESYGGVPEGPLLASILGHSLAIDLYGAPSEEETSSGAVTHGKIGVLPWRLQRSRSDALVGECDDEFGQLRFSRALCAKDSCVLIEESVTNLCRWDRPLGWQQHVSLGPPFYAEAFWAESNCDRGVTHPHSFGAGASLVPDSETRWPFAPRRAGGFSDYRQALEPAQIANDFTGFEVRAGDELGYLVAGNTDLGFALFYVWPRQFFPWMGVWDESHARIGKPWSKRTWVRAYEFGVSPYPLPRREMLAVPRLFDLPTYLVLPAGATLWVRYLVGVFRGASEAGSLEISGSDAALVKNGRTISRVALPEKCASSPRWEMAP